MATGTPPPNLAQQPASVQLHSSLALIGGYIYMLRQYFSSGGLPWQWVDNKTQTGVLIESAFEKNTEVNDFKPGVYVDRGQLAIQHVVIGDRDTNQPKIQEWRLEHFYTVKQTDMRITCVSARRGEALLLSDTVVNYLQASNRLIQSSFSFRDISPILASPVQNFELDETMYSVSINFRVETESRFATIPVAPVLHKIILQELSETQVNDLFVRIVLPSSNEI